MDSKDEYFRYCKANPQAHDKPGSDLFVVRVGPDICDECVQDPTIPMRTPPDEVKAVLFEGRYGSIIHFCERKGKLSMLSRLYK